MSKTNRRAASPLVRFVIVITGIDGARRIAPGGAERGTKENVWPTMIVAVAVCGRERGGPFSTLIGLGGNNTKT